MLAMDFSFMTFIILRVFSSRPFFIVFYHAVVLDLVSESIEIFMYVISFIPLVWCIALIDVFGFFSVSLGIVFIVFSLVLQYKYATYKSLLCFLFPTIAITSCHKFSALKECELMLL